jgi:5'-nucleotidase (lipoprotein e(P4) family)
MLPTLYHQNAVEIDAMCYQAYFLARIMVENDLKKGETGKKRAIITDIDETILDNSPYQAQCIIEGISYPEKWDDWCSLSSARAIPGSQQFFNYAADNGIEIFYVTNRKEHLKRATIINLKKNAFPFADEEHLLMRTNETSKESRRIKLSEEYRLILLLGDNIEDFASVFEQRPPEERHELAERLKESFGRRFITFPNAMYGSWEASVYGYDSGADERKKQEMRLNHLTGF